MIKPNKEFHIINGKWTHISTIVEPDGSYATYIDGKKVSGLTSFWKGYIFGFVITVICSIISFIIVRS